MHIEQTSFTLRNSSFMSTNLPKTTSEFSNFRSTAAVALRKQKRNDQIMHKRLNKLHNSPGNLISLEEAMFSLSLSNLSSIKALRKLLCQEKFDYIRLLQLKPDIVKFLAKGLDSNKNELLYEICWCFANLALGPPILINEVSSLLFVFTNFILHGDNKSLAEQACWILGNLAADNNHTKNEIKLVPGLVKAIINLLMLKNNSLCSVACWTLCNLIRGCNSDVKALLELGILNPVLELTHKNYSCQTVESLWLLSFLTCNANEMVYSQVYSQKNIEDYLKFLNFEDFKTVLPVIRILGNGFLYYPFFDYLFTSFSFVETLIKLLKSENFQIKKESFWMVSNLFTLNYVEIIMSYFGDDIIKVLINTIKEDSQEILTEVGISIYNLSEVCESFYLNRILYHGKTSLLKFFVNNIQNVPTWVKFDLQVICDVDLLKVSIGFIDICLQNADKSKEIEEFLYSDEVRETIEDCKYTLQKGQTKFHTNEAFIIQQCEQILKFYAPEFTFS